MSAPPKRPLRRLSDDDDLDDDDELRRHADRQLSSSRGGGGAQQHGGHGGHGAEEEEEEDELEAFMRQNAAEVSVVNAQPPKAAATKGVRDDIEEEDELEAYMNMMRAKGIEVGAAAATVGGEEDRDGGANSDEEVYAAAARADANGEDERAPVRKDIEPLAAVDHSLNDYIPINKDFYTEHEEIARLSAEQVGQLRRQLDMRVYGANVAKPCMSFAHFGFDEALLRTIINHGYTEPTSIQKQAIPVAMGGRDIIGVAKTGSGKTAAYLLPMLVHLMDQPELEHGDGPIGIVLAPTRELCMQIYQEAKKFAKAYDVKVVCIYGGASKVDQLKELRSLRPEIIVATPGRFIDMIKMKATNFRRSSFVVLDEADRMFDLGFEPQVRSIVTSVRPDRQTLMFSATFNRRVEHLCRDILLDPVRINIGNVGEANSDITQVALVFNDDSLKWPWIAQKLPALMVEGQIIIFVSRIGAVDTLAAVLRDHDYECGTLHGDMLQSERERVMRDFKKGRLLILVATDVAARGLDIPEVKTVINFDNPRDIDSHVHRIGRTGRAGQKGTAYTMITLREDKFAGDLVRNFEGAGQIVPPELLDLAMKNARFRQNRAGLGSGGGGGGGGGYRRGGGGGGGARGRGGRHSGLGASSSASAGPSRGPIHFQTGNIANTPAASSSSSSSSPSSSAPPMRFAPSSQPYSTVSASAPPPPRFQPSSQPYSTVPGPSSAPSSSNTDSDSSSSSNPAAKRSRWQ